ncbi:MAG: serine/threonine-protein kinase [Planctomycetota bacterium]
MRSDMGASPSGESGVHPQSDPGEGAPERARVRLPTRFGRYRLKRQLGRGRVGVVVEAADTTLKRRVALKLVRLPEGEAGRAVRRRTLEEARRAAGLAHPGIVQVFDVGRVEGWVYIAMEVMSGGDLAKRVERDGVLGVQEACKLVQQAAEGLAVGHAQGLVHRDVKPANLMLSRHGRCKVADFGIAGMEAELDAATGGDDGKREAAGTPNYMSPEAARGEVSPAGDAWGLLATLWYVLTGEPPFALERAQDAARVHRGIGLKPLESLRPGLPAVLVELLETGLGEDVERRPGDAAAVARALDAVVVPEARVKPVPVRRRRGTRPTGLRWIVAAGLLAVVVGGGVGWGIARSGSETKGSEDQGLSPTSREADASATGQSGRSEPRGGDWVVLSGLEGVRAVRASASHPSRPAERAWDGSRVTVWGSGPMASDGVMNYEVDRGLALLGGVPEVVWGTEPEAWGWAVWRGARGWMNVSPGWRGEARFLRLEMRGSPSANGVSIREFAWASD